MKVVGRRKDDALGTFEYQVEQNGKLHNNGEWVAQVNLAKC